MTTIDPSFAGPVLFSGLEQGREAGAQAAQAGRWVQSRSKRVCVLVGIVVVLSLADLYLTLLYLRSVGMGEANPLVHLILTYCSVEALAAWKILTVVFASAILLRLRHVRSAEIGAWACAIGLCILTVHWYRYSGEVTQLTPVIHKMASMECSHWIYEPQ